MIVILIIMTILLIACGLFVYQIKKEKYEKEIEELENTVQSLKDIKKEYENTITNKKNDIANDNKEIESLNNQMQELKERLSSTIQENNSKIDNLTMQLEIKNQLLIKEQKKYIEASNKIKEKESQRFAGVGTIAAKDRKIKKLEEQIKKERDSHKEELVKKDYTINFYKTHRRKPTEEEIKSYDFQFKEVERRQKNGK